MVYVKGSTREIDQISKLLVELDRPAEQVDISAVVYEYQVSEGDATAIGAVLRLAKGKLTGQIGAGDAIGDFLRFDSGNLSALLSMLNEDKRFQMISSPNVRAKSGASSRISVGADVPTLANVTQGNGTTTQAVNYQKTGVITLREILNGLNTHGGKLMQSPCRLAMKANPPVTRPEDSVDHLRGLMTELHITHVPVVDQAALVGILSFHDIARSAIKDVAFENKLLKQYIKNWPE